MNSENVYVQFPLFLVRDMFTKTKEVLNNIIYYGIYRCSQIFEFSYDETDVARQFIYDIYYGDVGDDCHRQLSLLKPAELGFTQEYMEKQYPFDKFEPESEITELLTMFETDEVIYNMALDRYLVYRAMKSLNMTLKHKSSVNNILQIAKRIEAKIPVKEPMPMLSKSLLFNFRDNDKSEFEMAQLLAYMAIKSILGAKPSAKTNKKHILARMFGYSTYPQSKNCKLNLYKKYSKRYHIDRVLQHLELNWQLKLYSDHNRGFYVGIGDAISFETLALESESRKLKNRISELARKKAEAKKKVALKLQLN